ncbi:MAG: 2-phospho-L-lactate guanylyltransferase [Actinomycetota bacterium]|nr:2-phospho-L-lactate guanylyltransferase [Actinomycetota bacterium]
MNKAILAAIPIKPFGVAKARLADRLNTRARSRLGKAIAARTAAAATDAGALVAIVTGDPGVTRWARTHGYLTIDEATSPREGLDGAAEAATSEAARRQRCWAIIHADLPLITPTGLSTVFALAERNLVIVPSHDGGTNVIAGKGTAVSFSYGPASFHRHLARYPQARIVTSPELGLDLDTGLDLTRAAALPAGRWLRDYLR